MERKEKRHGVSVRGKNPGAVVDQIEDALEPAFDFGRHQFALTSCFATYTVVCLA